MLNKVHARRCKNLDYLTVQTLKDKVEGKLSATAEIAVLG